jgi:hypothetical protein
VDLIVFRRTWRRALANRNERVSANAEAACRLNELRERWLNSKGATEAELKKRTLSNLYDAPSGGGTRTPRRTAPSGPSTAGPPTKAPPMSRRMSSSRSCRPTIWSGSNC